MVTGLYVSILRLTCERPLSCRIRFSRATVSVHVALRACVEFPAAPYSVLDAPTRQTGSPFLQFLHPPRFNLACLTTPSVPLLVAIVLYWIASRSILPLPFLLETAYSIRSVIIVWNLRHTTHETSSRADTKSLRQSSLGRLPLLFTPLQPCLAFQPCSPGDDFDSITLRSEGASLCPRIRSDSRVASFVQPTRPSKTILRVRKGKPLSLDRFVCLSDSPYLGHKSEISQVSISLALYRFCHCSRLCR